MIVTFCKSCRVIDKNIVDRCTYCGSKFVEFKNIDDDFIFHGNNRYRLKEEKKDDIRKR